MNEAFETALANAFDLQILFVMLLAAIYGLFVGAIPGLTATMAVALFVPFTFFLDTSTGLAAIVTLVACSIFAGDIPTTLVRIPGTPSSAAYTDDAYAMTRQGLHERSLGVSLVFSVVGGLLGSAVLIVAAPQLARVATQFSTFEYFWLFLLGLSCAAIVSRGSRLKGALALIIGLLFATIGMGEVHSQPRLTFGVAELITGINFIPAMIGLFGVSEVLRNVLVANDARLESQSNGQSSEQPSLRASLSGSIGRVFGGLPKRLWQGKVGVLRSSAIGSTVGMLPGAGADIAAWISYAASKRLSKEPDQYGTGSLEGIANATNANNSALAGAWIPALVLGIPGDSITAIVIGVLMMKRVTPGPEIFENPEQSVLVYGIYITFILANLLLIPLGFVAIQTGSLLVRVPRRVLMPVILLFCMVGAYAIERSSFDVWVMLGMGVLGFVLEEYEIPLGPVVLGIILGGRLEESFVRILTKAEPIPAFSERPIAYLLGALCLSLWLTPLALAIYKRASKTKRQPGPTNGSSG